MTVLFDNLRGGYEDEINRAMRGFPGEHAFFVHAKAKKIEALAARYRGVSSRLVDRIEVRILILFVSNCR